MLSFASPKFQQPAIRLLLFFAGRARRVRQLCSIAGRLDLLALLALRQLPFLACGLQIGPECKWFLLL